MLSPEEAWALMSDINEGMAATDAAIDAIEEGTSPSAITPSYVLLGFTSAQREAIVAAIERWDRSSEDAYDVADRILAVLNPLKEPDPQTPQGGAA